MFGDATQTGFLNLRMTELVDEEDALQQQLAMPLDPNRLEAVGTDLDRCWDVLSQRNARIAARPTSHAVRTSKEYSR